MVRQRSSPWFYGWNVVAAAFVAQAIAIGATTGAYGVYVLPLSSNLHATRFATTLAYALLMVVSGLSAPVVGAMIARGSIRRLMLAGLAAFAAGFALLSLATGIWQVIVLYALALAPASALAGPLPANTLTVNWFTTGRGRALGITTLAASVGILVFPPIAALFVRDSGWRDSYRVLAVIALLALLPVWLLVRDRPSGGADGIGASSPDVPDRYEGSQALPTNMQVLRDGAFWAIALAAGLGECVMSGVLVNVVPMAIDRGYGAEESAYLISILTGGLMLGKILIGAAGDRIRLPTLWVLSLMLAALGAVLLAYSATMPLLACAAILVGIGSGGYYPLMGLSIAASFPRAAFSRVMGFVLPVLYLMAAPGAPLGGLIHDRFGTYTAAMWIFVAVLVVGAAIMTIHAMTARLSGRDAERRPSP